MQDYHVYLIPFVHTLTLSFIFSFFFYSSGDHRDLHSFPTRRSSDLDREVRRRDLGIGLDAHARFAALRELDLRAQRNRSEEHTSELQSRFDLVCRLLLEKKKI